MNAVRIVTQWAIGTTTDPSPGLMLALEGIDREVPLDTPLRGQEGGRFLLTSDTARQIGLELVRAAEELESSS